MLLEIDIEADLAKYYVAVSRDSVHIAALSA